MLEFKDVAKYFQDGNQKIEAVKPTTLKFNQSELVAIIGPSGSGKSTFLTMAGALQTPSSGDIIINNKDVSQMSRALNLIFSFASMETTMPFPILPFGMLAIQG